MSVHVERGESWAAVRASGVGLVVPLTIPTGALEPLRRLQQRWSPAALADLERAVFGYFHPLLDRLDADERRDTLNAALLLWHVDPVA
jgi:hypothetical protein